MNSFFSQQLIRFTSLVALAFVLAMPFGFAQTPERLTDINSATISSDPSHLKVYNDKLMFFAKVPFTNGINRLWKTDGTSAGTIGVVSSLDYSHSSGEFATTVAGIHYYQSGGRLVRTDATEAGTSVVKDFGQSFVQMYETGGRIFITTYNSSQQLGELWVSDGSVANTTKIKTFDGPPVFSNTAFNYIENVRLYQGEIFFTIQTSLNPGCCGQELWRSDGTSAGTVSLDGAARFSYSFVFQNSLFFFRPDGLRKNTLSYDNEILIKEMLNYGYLTKFQAVESGAYMYFLLGEINSHLNSVKEELWRTDGTDAGTIKLYTSETGSTITSLTDVNGSLYCASGYNVIKSDGSVAGTFVVKDYTLDAVGVKVYPSNFVAVGSKLFFSAFTLLSGHELWTSDGVTTQLVPSPESASARSLNPRNIIKFGTKVFFTGTGSLSGTELFSSDGTVVSLVKDIERRAGGSAISKITPTRTKIYFTAGNDDSGIELWRTDGTSDGETMVNELTLESSSNPLELIQLKGDTLLYTSFDGTKRHLYSTLSTSPLLELNGSDNGTYLFPKRIDNAIYFSHQDAVQGRELMKTDVATTQRLTDLAAGNNGSVFYNFITKFNNGIYFNLYDVFQPVNSGLYKVDASAAGASLVKAFTAMGPFVACGGYLYFTAYDPATGMELWRTDGTTAGTILLKDINPGIGSSNSNSGLDSEENLDGAVAFNGKLYFIPYVGSTAHLWATDGTEAGTVKVSEINASRLTVAGDKLFFSGSDGVYVTDGTVAGTVRVAAELNPYQFHAFRDHLVYSANGKLRITNGLALGTQTLATFPDSYVGWTKHLGNTLYFSADDVIYGQELWKVKLEDPPVITAVQQSATDKRSFTITGSNLSTTSAVYFAGAAATSFTVISDTEIVAMVPNVDASGIVIVNTAGGSATKSGFVFSVVPVLTSFAPVIGVTGSHIILKGSQFTGVNSVSFGGKSASSFVITSDTEIDAVVGAETSSGEVSVTRNTQVGSLAGFTFYGPPVIESLTPSAALRGSEVTVKGKNFYLVSSILLGSINVTEFTIIGTEELKFIVPGKALTGDLKITAASGTVTTQLVVEIPVGVEDSELSDQIEFYPNPVERILQIAYNEELTSEAAIRMFDSRGVPVSGFQIHGTRGRWEVDMQAVATGMYVLLLNRGGKFSKVFKVIKK